LGSLFAVEKVTVVMQGAVSAVQPPFVGGTGLDSVPVPAFQRRITSVAAAPVFCTKATCVPSKERTGEVRTAPVVPVLYAQ